MLLPLLLQLRFKLAVLFSQTLYGLLQRRYFWILGRLDVKRARHLYSLARDKIKFTSNQNCPSYSLADSIKFRGTNYFIVKSHSSPARPPSRYTFSSG